VGVDFGEGIVWIESVFIWVWVGVWVETSSGEFGTGIYGWEEEIDEPIEQHEYGELTMYWSEPSFLYRPPSSWLEPITITRSRSSRKTMPCG
jgi:hypothetical protein